MSNALLILGARQHADKFAGEADGKLRHYVERLADELESSGRERKALHEHLKRARENTGQWANHARTAQAERDRMGREMSKLQDRIHRQRIANRELLGREKAERG